MRGMTRALCATEVKIGLRSRSVTEIHHHERESTDTAGCRRRTLFKFCDEKAILPAYFLDCTAQCKVRFELKVELEFLSLSKPAH